MVRNIRRPVAGVLVSFRMISVAGLRACSESAQSAGKQPSNCPGRRNGMRARSVSLRPARFPAGGTMMIEEITAIFVGLAAWCYNRLAAERGGSAWEALRARLERSRAA